MKTTEKIIKVLEKYGITNHVAILFTQGKTVEELASEIASLDINNYPDTEADGYVFCGKCGKMK